MPAQTIDRESQRADGTADRRNVALDCGWGRLLFRQTFDSREELLDSLLQEKQGRRDIAFYVDDPHVLLSLRPQQIFLDPSHSYRLDLDELVADRRPPVGFEIRRLETPADAAAVNRCYAKHDMVPVDSDFLLARRGDARFIHLLAVDGKSGETMATVTGIDHRAVFDDPQAGASLWCLAVDPQAPYPGIGEALVRRLGALLAEQGCRQLDLSVMHYNEQAIALYEKLGFRRIPVFALKTRNSINEMLYSGPVPEEALNPYAQIIVDEARRRGIAVEVLDAEAGFFRLTHGARSIVCREALSELTSAVALSRCDDKAVTHRILAQAGLRLAEQRRAGAPEENRRFLAQCGSVVVKPRRGEQGRGVYVDLRTPDEVEQAVADARALADDVLIERFVAGEDLRIIVINFEVVAAAVRRPPEVTGTGEHSIAELIEAQSRRRAAATDGESHIPLDAETRRCVEAAGYTLESTLPKGEALRVRKAANLHTGGTIHDVTDALHPVLAEAAVAAARALDIPVAGLDFLVRSPGEPDYVIVEVNERPGLANHAPAPTAERFIDLLFPQLVTDR